MTTHSEKPEAADNTPDPSVPHLAEGIDLIGEYEGSGFKETPYLARRMDGQTLQLTGLLYFVAEEVNGERDFEAIAERVSEKFGRTVSGDNVKFLVEEKLRPIGVLAQADGSSPKLAKADPALALNFRAGIVPEKVVKAVTTAFYPLFFAPVMVAFVGAFIALDVWLFFFHGIGQSVRDLVYQPILFLMVFGIVVFSAAFHEIGHATACRYGGAKPGKIGAGIYLVYPAFYSDVTDTYRLGKLGRVRTDLGGIYFNIIFSLLTAGAYFYTGFEPLLAIILIQHFEMLFQLMPFIRLDGYYIISDITGVPDLFSRIKPILKSLVPGREAGAEVTALKPWVRVVVTAWVITAVPVLLYLLVVMGMNAPRMFATGYDSFFVQYDRASAAFAEGAAAKVAVGAIQIFALVLPLAGMTFAFSRLGKNLGVMAWRGTSGKPMLRGGIGAAATLSIGILAFIMWPNGDYKPIQPAETGTIQASLAAFKDIPGGRPGLTESREAELEGAPTLRSQTEPSPDSGWTSDLFISPSAASGEPGASEPGASEPGASEPDSEAPSEASDGGASEPDAEAAPGGTESPDGAEAPDGTSENGASGDGASEPGSSESAPVEATSGVSEGGADEGQNGEGVSGTTPPEGEDTQITQDSQGGGQVEESLEQTIIQESVETTPPDSDVNGPPTETTAP